MAFLGICQETASDDTTSHEDIIITICIYILSFTKRFQNLSPVTITDYRDEIWLDCNFDVQARCFCDTYMMLRRVSMPLRLHK